MSFFKDFKDDLSQAVNELISEEGTELEEEVADSSIFNKSESSYNVSDEIARFREEIATEEQKEELEEESSMEEESVEEVSLEELIDESLLEEISGKENLEEEKVENNHMTMTVDYAEDKENISEVTTITKGVHLSGDLSSEGSVDLFGSITGDLTCLGKLAIYGSIVGNPSAEEIQANSARIEGNITSEGSVNIGNGSVVIGNIVASSAIIGGAVKGDIDVQGPVIIDATAVVYGNIKSRSVQLNNGAVLEGVVSQCYSGVDVEALFNEKNDKNKR